MGNQLRKFLVGVVLLSVVSTSLGCQSFRKKFVRQKKEERNERFIPVLDPIDYPAKIQSAEDQYKHAYSLWKVWSTDYVHAFEENDSDKKQKYNLAQALKALEDMKNAVKDDKKAGIDELITKVNAINAEYEKDVNLRPSYQIKSGFEKVMSQVRNQFSPNIMTDQYAN